MRRGKENITPLSGLDNIDHHALIIDIVKKKLARRKKLREGGTEVYLEEWFLLIYRSYSYHFHTLLYPFETLDINYSKGELRRFHQHLFHQKEKLLSNSDEELPQMTWKNKQWRYYLKFCQDEIRIKVFFPCPPSPFHIGLCGTREGSKDVFWTIPGLKRIYAASETWKVVVLMKSIRELGQAYDLVECSTRQTGLSAESRRQCADLESVYLNVLQSWRIYCENVFRPIQQLLLHQIIISDYRKILMFVRRWFVLGVLSLLVSRFLFPLVYVCIF